MDPVSCIIQVFTDYEALSAQTGLVAKVRATVGKNSHELLKDLGKLISHYMPLMPRFDVALLEKMRDGIVTRESDKMHPTILKIEQAIQKAKGEPDRKEFFQRLLGAETQIPPISLNPKRKSSKSEGKRDSARTHECAGGEELEVSLESSQSPKSDKRRSLTIKRNSIHVHQVGGEEEIEIALEISQSPKRKPSNRKSGKKPVVEDTFRIPV